MWGETFIIPCVNSQLPSIIWWKHCSPPIEFLSTLFNNQLTINAYIYFWTFNLIPLKYECILYIYFISVPHCLDYCSFVVTLKLENMSIPTLVFSRIILSVLFMTWLTISVCVCVFLNCLLNLQRITYAFDLWKEKFLNLSWLWGWMWNGLVMWDAAQH